MNYWLLKTEPEEYSFSDLLKDKETVWTGIRNHQAKNNLLKMKKGDAVFIYHTGDAKAVVGIAEVTKEAFIDPKDEEKKFYAVSIKPVKALKTPVALEKIKQNKNLSTFSLVKQGRLSVHSLSKNEWEEIQKI